MVILNASCRKLNPFQEVIESVGGIWIGLKCNSTCQWYDDKPMKWTYAGYDNSTANATEKSVCYVISSPTDTNWTASTCDQAFVMCEGEIYFGSILNINFGQLKRVSVEYDIEEIFRYFLNPTQKIYKHVSFHEQWLRCWTPFMFIPGQFHIITDVMSGLVWKLALAGRLWRIVIVW